MSNISHEIRTPLNSILGFSELIIDESFTEIEKQDFAKSIVLNGNNLLNVINDIIDISKIESGEITVRKGNVLVNSVVEEIVRLFKYRIQENKLDFVVSSHEPIDETCCIYADKDRVIQIFTNLVGNALKFTHQGHIELGYRPIGNFVEFYVMDTGIGIAPEFHEKIFERFRQVEDSDSRKHGGNGLGLAITKNLVELMGGKIWLESEPGRGTKFYFTLPSK